MSSFRYYNPQTGRFLSEDPIGFAGVDFNLYRYVGNNPLNYTDPSGKFVLFISRLVIVGARLTQVLMKNSSAILATLVASTSSNLGKEERRRKLKENADIAAQETIRRKCYEKLTDPQDIQRCIDDVMAQLEKGKRRIDERIEEEFPTGGTCGE